MMGSNHIIDVSEETFEFEVINYSQNTPVVVDFWANWCVPCKVLGPILEKLATESNGAFRLAKVDVDESPNLAKHYNVRSIPAVKAFNHGQVVSEFNGASPEPRIKEFLRALVPAPGDLLLEKANSLLKMHQWSTAEKSFRKFLETNIDNPEGLLGVVKSLLAQGQWKEALSILRSFPASPQYNKVILLIPLANAFAEYENNLPGRENPLEAAYQNSLRLATRGNLLAALDGLLDILRQDKKYRDGQVRQVVIGMLELLGDDDQQTRQYRNELATILF
jgi:putative thioredoxin